MVEFVKLTKTDGVEIWFNLGCIEAITTRAQRGRPGEVETIVIPAGVSQVHAGQDPVHVVKEDLEEVMRRIRCIQANL